MKSSLATKRWMTNRMLLASILLALILRSTTLVNGEATKPIDEHHVSFQDTRWLATADVQLKVEKYRGHESLKIQTGSLSVAKVADVAFSTGRIEFDLALAGRIAPWFCFGVAGEVQTNADKVMVNPWPKHVASGDTRLYQAVLTKRERNFLVLNYRQSSETFDANRWAHVTIDVCEKRCRIFIDDDRTPAIELDNPFAAGTVGIQGKCYIRDLKIDGDVYSPKQRRP